MAKTPSKRGSGRGKTGAGNGKPATKRDGPKKSTGKKAAGKKLPGWMPDDAAGGKPPRHEKQAAAQPDRKSGTEGKDGSGRVRTGGHRNSKKKTKQNRKR